MRGRLHTKAREIMYYETLVRTSINVHNQCPKETGIRCLQDVVFPIATTRFRIHKHGRFCRCKKSSLNPRKSLDYVEQHENARTHDDAD
jgi:hypothetical protein